jgi:hypothetical protein
MRARHGTAALLAALATLALGATSSVAARGGNQPIRGIVIGVTAESLEVQTETGGVTVAITDDTRVIRTVSGTLADLRRGQVANLVLDRGRISQIHIAPPGTKLAGSNPSRGRGRSHRTLGPVRILAATRRTIRVRYGNGRIVTYTLAARPKVIKDVPGLIEDLAVGQTVLVTRSHGGRVAVLIDILRG